MPQGRVAERIQALQNGKKERTSTVNLTAAQQTISSAVSPAESVVDAIHKPGSHIEVVEDTASTASTSHSKSPSVMEHRGRTGEREEPGSLITPTRTHDSVNETLEDVRARLYSVQRIVKRERSGSSQARDEVMDELGSMIDSAIATTMTPLPSPKLPARAASSRRASRPRPQSSVSSLARSQSLNPRFKELDRPSSGAGTMTATQPSLSGNQKYSAFPPHLFSVQSVSHRARQSSEPAPIMPRRTGFPLTNPVRERALL